MAISETHERWASPDGVDLMATIYRPQGNTVLPALIDVHGGAWSSGERANGAVYDRALAEAGFVVVAIDFRHAPASMHPTASRDVVGAVRWLRLHAERLCADVTRVGLVGSSSGGHLVLLAATKPTAPEHGGTPIVTSAGVRVRDDVDASVDFVIALWPVADPHYRWRYAKRAGIDRLRAATESYFGTEDAMRAASVPRLVIAGEAERLPATLVVQPGEDANVPIEMTFDLLRAWQGRHGHIEYLHYPRLPHGFAQRAGSATDDCVRAMVDFCCRRQSGAWPAR